MIPKIIHYCWFGNNEKPQLVKDCIKSWNDLLPSYKIIEWNENNTDLSNSFVKKSYKLKKWAFVSDYVRLEKLFEYGGVYLDTDMLLMKNIDDLLGKKMFIGSEDDSNISGGIIGASKNNDFFKTLLTNYDSMKMTKFTNLYDITIPKLITNLYRYKYSYKGKFDRIVENKECIVYPKDYFYPLPSSNTYKKSNYKDFLTIHSYAVHLWGESWLLPNEFELIRKKKYITGFKQIFYSFYYQKNKLKYCKKFLYTIKESLGTFRT